MRRVQRTRAVILVGCAWVLWAQVAGGVGWRPFAEYPTLDECRHDEMVRTGNGIPMREIQCLATGAKP